MAPMRKRGRGRGPSGGREGRRWLQGKREGRGQRLPGMKGGEGARGPPGRKGGKDPHRPSLPGAV